jgi:general secretion pathway protein D
VPEGVTVRSPEASALENTTEPFAHGVTASTVDSLSSEDGQATPTVLAPAGQSFRPAARVSQGTGTFVAAPVPAKPIQSPPLPRGADVNLSFVGADLRDVARTILGDMLGVNFVIDPAVQGTITLQTSQPIDRSSALSVFEDALRANGATVIAANGLYRIVPLAEAARRSGGVMRPDTQGYGIKVVTLNFVSAQEMKTVLEPLVPANAILRVDNTRNLLIIAGTQKELSAMLDTISIFDVDWLQGMSFAVYPLRWMNAKTIVEELQFVFGRDAGTLRDVVRLFPLDRLNSVIVVSTQPRYLREVEKWISYLDQPSQTQERRIYIYSVRHGKAVNLAAALNRTFGIGGGAGGVVDDGGAGLGVGAARLAADGSGSTKQAPSLSDSVGRPTPDAQTQAAAPAASRSGENIRITPEEDTNSLLIYASTDEYAGIEAALDKLDVVPLQVLIEGVVAEVTLTDELRYGVQWFIDAGKGEFTLSDAATGAVSSQFPGFSFVLSGMSNIRAVLNALSEVTDVNVISAPEVMVLSNQTAFLQVGDQVPVATQSAQSILDPNALLVNTVQYKDTGVILEVKPRVNASGTIVMDVSQTVSDVVPTTTSSLNSPTIRQRQIASSIAVESGETIALGGLIRDGRTNTHSGVPILKDIPYLGSLFGTKTNTMARTELLVLMTPRIVRNTEDARRITEELRQRMRVVQPLDARIRQ